MLSLSVGAAGTPAAAHFEVVVVAGLLSRQSFSSEVFHIGPLWIGILRDTQFHRWLSQGTDRKVVILLTSNPVRFDDAKNTRVLSGTLIHGTALNPFPGSGGQKGMLPEGDLAFVHIVYLKDERTGSLGPLTFETADLETASKFAPYDGTHVSIVIQIE